RLRPAPAVDSGRLERWLRGLESDRFVERERATTALERLGDAAVPYLRRALAGTPAPETRRRLEHLLEKLEPLSRTPQRVREVRAVEVLERIGTPGARALLQALAGGGRWRL